MPKASKATAAASATREPVRFQGIPSGLTGVVAEGVYPASELALTVRGIRGVRDGLDVAIQAELDARVLQMVLPSDVAPGRYDGELRIDGVARPAQVEVEASPLLRVFPEQLRLIGRGGESIVRSLSILNAGNVPIDIRKVQAFGVIQSGGIERALRRAYVSKLAVAERRIDVIAESLAQAHGGLVKMSVTSGAGELKEGELRALEVSVKLPADLAPGAEYSGNWELIGLVYPVVIQVPGARSAPDDVPEDEDEVPVIG